MKRWISHLTIAAYLSTLGWGIASHTVGYGANIHPAMYFVVWDMFCGWGAYSNRVQIIAEGESGEYYQVAPAPWGTLKPFGHLDRRHYDYYGVASPRMATNILNHTSHEPITRVYVIDECWPKQYNIPDRLWARRYNEPKDIHRYYHVREVLAGDGSVLERRMNWYDYQYAQSVSDNPRLQAEASRGTPLFTISPASQQQRRQDGVSFDEPRFGSSSRFGSGPLGN